MENIKTITELLVALGWTDLGPQKNQWMISFTKDTVRLNIYHTTMTVTVQYLESMKGGCTTHRDVTLEKLEQIVNKIK